MSEIDPHLPDRAQTEEEKKAVLDSLAAAWAAHPEQRLGQLISNSLYYIPQPRPCIHFVEDKPLEAALQTLAAGEPFPKDGGQ